MQTKLARTGGKRHLSRIRFEIIRPQSRRVEERGESTELGMTCNKRTRFTVTESASRLGKRVHGAHGPNTPAIPASRTGAAALTLQHVHRRHRET